MNHPLKSAYTAMPLYQQAFRWFRENHNLTHMISENNEMFIFGVEGLKAHGSSNTSYEEAELACLKKLIELSNSKVDKTGT
jgi:hypothetical protein